LNDLISALGNQETQNKYGEKIFTGAWELINTAQRIDRAIRQFPFRQNIPPKSPDIFHLRIGAANFFIPPVKIDVDTRFKTSSLGAQGLRQKNSAKFNAGYKENVIPQSASAVVDGRFLPGYEDQLHQTIRKLAGDEIEVEILVRDIALEVDFAGPLVEAMCNAISAEDPDGMPLGWEWMDGQPLCEECVERVKQRQNKATQ